MSINARLVDSAILDVVLMDLAKSTVNAFATTTTRNSVKTVDDVKTDVLVNSTGPVVNVVLPDPLSTSGVNARYFSSSLPTILKEKTGL